MKQAVRIGNAQAFWGDRGDAAAEMLAREPDLDYLTMDYLAEVSMSILAVQRDRDPEVGFAQDFVDVVRSLAPYWAAGGKCRLIANAGGLNPRGCAEACRAAIEAAGCRSLRIGVVSGDDVLEVVRAAANDAASQAFRNLDSGAAIHEVADRLVTGNAYLGATPIVEALAAGADLVITGRVADPSLVVAACVYHFGWSDDDLDRLAGATVAGHLIECGTQVTGGISTDWLDMPDPTDIGFPIVEVAADGSCIVTKPHGTGGRVTELTVKEQLVYEIGDPENYLSPDVTVSFSTLAVEDLGNNRVRVFGASGRPHPDSYKVSATFRDGFRAAGSLTIFGRDAVAKAKRCGELVLRHVREAGFELRDSVVECLGSGACAAGIVDQPDRAIETVLRVAVEADSRDAVERFSRELMPLITAGSQGTTGYADGRPRIHPVIRYWPCLIPRDSVVPRVEYVAVRATNGTPSSPPKRFQHEPQPADSVSHKGPSALYDIAVARSGDKGSNANIGVIARRGEAWEFLQSWLTVDRVAAYFAPLGVESVERFELPNLGALNFVLRGVLQCSLRTDAQGKTLGQILLEMPLPAEAVRMISEETHSYDGLPRPS
ncbi:MAG: acyclic terpene utilization AtuA family protein [Planctomycetota bacterium]